MITKGSEMVAEDAAGMLWEDTFYSDLGEFPPLLAAQLAEGTDFDFCQTGGDSDTNCGGS